MLVSPCTLCPLGFGPSLAGCAAGVKFLLLHLSLFMYSNQYLAYGASIGDGIRSSATSSPPFGTDQVNHSPFDFIAYGTNLLNRQSLRVR